MIRPLRQRHRRIVTILLVLMPLAFVAANLARRPIPISEASVFDPAVNGGSAGVSLAQSIPLTNQLRSDGADSTRP